MAALLEVCGLTKRYGECLVLEVPYLAFRAGQIHGVVGPNGAGKSTLLEILAGLTPATTGTVRLRGRDLPPAPRAAAVLARELTLVGQHAPLFRGTVRGNVAYGLKAQGVPRKAREEKISAMLAALRLEKLANRDVYQLSAGEAQRVALARALVRDVTLFLLDEPLTNLDGEHRQTALDQLARARAEGKTLIVAAHQVGALSEMADRVVVLEGGRCAGLSPEADGVPMSCRK